VADPSGKSRSDVQTTREKRQFKHKSYLVNYPDVACGIPRTSHYSSMSLIHRRTIMCFENFRATSPQMPQESPPAASKEGPSSVESKMEAKRIREE
jgi:hypothetical protein